MRFCWGRGVADAEGNLAEAVQEPCSQGEADGIRDVQLEVLPEVVRIGVVRVCAGGGGEAICPLIAEGVAVRSTVVLTRVEVPTPTKVQRTLLSIITKMLSAAVTDGHVIGRSRVLNATQVLPHNFDRETRGRDLG